MVLRPAVDTTLLISPPSRVQESVLFVLPLPFESILPVGLPLALCQTIVPSRLGPVCQTTTFQPSALLGNAELFKVNGPPPAAANTITVSRRTVKLPPV